jgi:hypothetical protein
MQGGLSLVGLRQAAGQAGPPFTISPKINRRKRREPRCHAEGDDFVVGGLIHDGYWANGVDGVREGASKWIKAILSESIWSVTVTV